MTTKRKKRYIPENIYKSWCLHTAFWFPHSAYIKSIDFSFFVFKRILINVKIVK